MLGTVGVVVGWFAAAVAVVAYMSGPSAAVALAKQGGQTAGVTAAAMVSFVQDAASSFQDTKPDKPKAAKPKPKS